MTQEEKMLLEGVQMSLDRMNMQLSEIRAAAKAVREVEPREIPRWVTLKEAADLKGGVVFTTYQQRRFMMPCCGLNYHVIGGRRCWRREDVLEWLEVDDLGLEAYAKKWGAPPPPERVKYRSN